MVCSTVLLRSLDVWVCVCVSLFSVSVLNVSLLVSFVSLFVFLCSVTGGELFEDIVAREYYSEADARWALQFSNLLLPWLLLSTLQQAGHADTHTHAHARIIYAYMGDHNVVF